MCVVRFYNKVFIHHNHTYSLKCASYPIHKHHLSRTNLNVLAPFDNDRERQVIFCQYYSVCQVTTSRNLLTAQHLEDLCWGFFWVCTGRKEQIQFLSREEEQSSSYPNYNWSNMVQGSCVSFGLPTEEAPVAVGCHSSGTNYSFLELIDPKEIVLNLF